MPDDVSDATSTLPATLPTCLSPPKPKKRRRELSNAQRADIRQQFYHNPSPKPTQNQLIQWFEEKHYYKLT
jgi:Fission yeast centromere protein N-terminal domain